AVDGSLILYLRAHPSLARLYFRNTHLFVSKHVETFVDTFYREVPSRHASTLTHLIIELGRWGRWSFGADNANAISTCTEPVELCVAID
ncbi:hypothetical protein DFH09DRAFT_882738, partial [Mycena vulgaris]